MARILVGFDGSPPSRRALEWALDRTGGDDEVILVTAIPSAVAGTTLTDMMPAGLTLPPQLGKTFEQNAQSRLDEVVRQYAPRKVRMHAVVRQGDPTLAFMEAVKEFAADQIVIGHKSYESDEMKLGPIAQRLVQHMPATVTVVR